MVRLFTDPVTAANITDFLPTFNTNEDVNNLSFVEFRLAHLSSPPIQGK
jgi:hypothetical protein